MNQQLDQLVKIVQQSKIDFKFTLFEVGALQIESSKEPFYELLDYFPSSKIIGFEVEKDICDKMNSMAQKGVKYYAYTLGKANEKRKFYVTQHPMCCSLYKPNETLISLYHNFQVAYLKYETEVETISLDYFVDQQKIEEIDFIKIDVQGAELDIFKGGSKALNSVLQIISEVEFIEHYEDQPLFGDVCNFLNKHNLMFNKFLGLAGRALKPIIIDNNANNASQHIWSDAVFTYHVQKIQNLNDEKLLKLSLLACVYGSLDLSFYCLSHYDKRHSSSFSKDWMKKISK